MGKLTALVAVLFLAVGAGQAGKGMWIYVKAHIAQQLIERAWSHALAGDENFKPWPWADTYPVARIVVPRLGVDVIALAGDSGRTLAFGPGVSFGNDLVEGEGVTLISGHRDTHFSFLGDLVIGDRLLVTTTSRRTYIYEMKEQVVFDVNDGEFLAQDDSPILALVTCWPLDAITPGGSMRMAVIAESVLGQVGDN